MTEFLSMRIGNRATAAMVFPIGLTGVGRLFFHGEALGCGARDAHRPDEAAVAAPGLKGNGRRFCLPGRSGGGNR
ncbi:MAG TPA: hypothetical protein PKH99_06515 [Vicinamibacterales bacterium]|nr:hypothetical protein [Vicinamibacterales bacterium]